MWLQRTREASDVLGEPTEANRLHTRSYLQFEGANSTFYHKWFGSDVDSFVDQVITGFKNISTNNFANYTFNCGESASLCEPGVNAYVFPSQ